MKRVRFSDRCIADMLDYLDEIIPNVTKMRNDRVALAYLLDLEAVRGQLRNQVLLGESSVTKAEAVQVEKLVSGGRNYCDVEAWSKLSSRIRQNRHRRKRGNNEYCYIRIKAAFKEELNGFRKRQNLGSFDEALGLLLGYAKRCPSFHADMFLGEPYEGIDCERLYDETALKYPSLLKDPNGVEGWSEGALAFRAALGVSEDLDAQNSEWYAFLVKWWAKGYESKVAMASTKGSLSQADSIASTRRKYHHLLDNIEVSEVKDINWDELDDGDFSDDDFSKYEDQDQDKKQEELDVSGFWKE